MFKQAAVDSSGRANFIYTENSGPGQLDGSRVGICQSSLIQKAVVRRGLVSSTQWKFTTLSQHTNVKLISRI